MEFANHLTQLRKAKGWTQSDLASRIDSTQSTVSQLESGDRQPSFDMIRRLTEALDVSASDLLGEPPLEMSPEELAHFRKFRALPSAAQQELAEFATYLRVRHRDDSPDG
jgi:transcriptional regulator with XRE-family HTH domain